MRRSRLLLLFCLGFCFVLILGQDQNEKDHTVHYLEADNGILYQPKMRHRGFFENDLQIYCYRGNKKTIARFFETIELQLDIDGDDYIQYEGESPEEVQQHRDEHRSLFSFSLFSQKKSRLQLSPFEQQCIGIESTEAYRLKLHQVRIDFWRAIQLTVGLMFFLTAEKLSHNSIFYYITGITLGICSSFMLLIWLTGKLFPRKMMMYGVLLGGWTIGIYIIQMLWENLQLIVLTYRTHVFWYIFITGLISFLFCYRIGPPKNKRSKKIVKWLLQLMSLILIYFSSRFEEAAAACIILAIIYHYFPRVLFRKIRSLILHRFPPKRRLLTSEEYYEEGVRETTKALKELREFASSPECKQWKIMTKLNDPMRFAAFVEGASHLRDEEILRFDCYKSEREDDDDDVDTEYSQEEDEIEKFRVTPKKNPSRQHLVSPVRRSSYLARSLPASEIMDSDENEVDHEEKFDVKREPSSSQHSFHRQTATLNNSRRHIVNGNHYQHLSPTSNETHRSSRSISNASRTVTTRRSIQRTLQSPNNSSRTFENENELGNSSSN